MFFFQIVSWFYYWRAAWNIVERKKAYPDEPLPDPEFLRKDFDKCVLTSKALTLLTALCLHVICT